MSRLVRLVLGSCLLLIAFAASSTSASAAVCADYSNQAEAQQAADTRDADSDGLYCEALPCPCSSGTGGYDMGKRLVAAGLSAIFVRDGRTFARQSQYEALEAQARSDRTASWGVCDGGPQTDG